MQKIISNVSNFFFALLLESTVKFVKYFKFVITVPGARIVLSEFHKPRNDTKPQLLATGADYCAQNAICKNFRGLFPVNSGKDHSSGPWTSSE